MNLSQLSKSLTSFSAVVMLVVLGLVLIAMIGCGSSRSTTAPGQANASGKASAETDEADTKALGTLGKRSWYDSAKGEYRPPKAAAEVDHPLRRGGTVAGPAGSTPVSSGGGGGGGTWSWPSGEVIGYAILITLGTALVAVAVFLIFASLRTWLPGKGIHELQHRPIAIDPARVADLPFEAQSQMEDPLAYARHLIGQGNFDEAVIFIYGYMLLALDRAGKITLHRGKTNRMYLQELKDETQLRGILLPAMLAFEDVFFGRHSIEQERFRKIWDGLDEFHRALAPSIATAAPLTESAAP